MLYYFGMCLGVIWAWDSLIKFAFFGIARRKEQVTSERNRSARLHHKSKILMRKGDFCQRKTCRKRYNKYKSALGKSAPKALEEFQKIKYSDNEYYRYVKLDYEQHNKLIMHPELKLPNAEKATADNRKFTGYLIDPNNAEGWAKGKAFTSRLGCDGSNYSELKSEILKSAVKYPSKSRRITKYGKSYEQKIILYGNKRKPANVIVGWLCEEDNSKMVTAYIKEVGE